MKRILLLIPWLFISCTTTRQFYDKDTEIKYIDDNGIDYILTGTKTISENEADINQVLYQTIGLPAATVFFTVRETAKIVGYSFINIFAGAIAAIDSNYMPVAPDLKKNQDELEKLEQEIKDSEYYKYKKFISPCSVAKITEVRYSQEVDFNKNKKEIDSAVIKTVKVKKDLKKDLKKNSKKASIIGSKIGNILSYIMMFPSYLFGIIIFGLGGRA